MRPDKRRRPILLALVLSFAALIGVTALAVWRPSTPPKTKPIDTPSRTPTSVCDVFCTPTWVAIV